MIARGPSARCHCCGRPWRAGARFCPSCGAASDAPALPPYAPPAVPHRGAPVLAVVLVAVLVGVLVAGGIAVAVGGWPAVLPPGPTSVPTPVPAAASATQMLAAQVAADRPVAEALVGEWLPQIGSKAVGTAVGGIVYDEDLIWAQYRTTAARYPGVVLVRSEEFTSFRRAGYWVLLVAAPQPSADAVHRWCVAAGLPAEECFAKRLSHTEGPAGNTKQR